MRTPLILLRGIAKGLLNVLSGGLLGDVLGEMLPDVAEDVWGWWKKDRNDGQRRQDLEALAQASPAAVQDEARNIVLELASGAAPDLQLQMMTYLEQVPPLIRKTLRRPADPSGRTVTEDRVPQKADDLLPLLPARLPRFKPGDRPLAGVDWQVEELLGVGGCGEVWRARNPHLASAPHVALKFCLDAPAARVLRNEAAVLDRVMRQGRHPGIVQLQHTYLSAESPCLEYEYVEGGDLAGLVRDGRHATAGAHDAGRIVWEIASIVGFAHRLDPPIVHRDLKPANILRHRNGSGWQFKIADFGIGGVASQHALSHATRGTTRGQFLLSALRGACTPLYASPQQQRGEAPDPRDDVYALGVIWYQLLCGDLTLGRPGGTRWQKRLAEQGMSTALLDLLAECLEDAHADRPKDAAVLAEQLGALLDLKKAHITSMPQPGPSRNDNHSIPSPVPREMQTPLPKAPDVRVDFWKPKLVRQLDVSDEEALRQADRDLRTAQKRATQAEALRQHGDLELAVREATEALKLDPRNVLALYCRGAAHLMAGQYDRTIQDCTEAIRIDPDYWWAYGCRGAGLRHKGELERAVADLTEALRYDPGYAWALAERGAAHRLSGQLNDAIRDCTDALRVEPATVLALYNRGEAYRTRGELERAIADCTEAIRIDPRYSWAHGTRGAAHRQKGAFPLAVKDLVECLRLDPGYEWAAEQLELARRRQRT
jgi:serine/threonine protein kinase/lipoprotein NlpI